VIEILQILPSSLENKMFRNSLALAVMLTTTAPAWAQQSYIPTDGNQLRDFTAAVIANVANVYSQIKTKNPNFSDDQIADAGSVLWTQEAYKCVKEESASISIEKLMEVGTPVAGQQMKNPVYYLYSAGVMQHLAVQGRLPTKTLKDKDEISEYVALQLKDSALPVSAAAILDAFAYPARFKMTAQAHPTSDVISEDFIIVLNKSNQTLGEVLSGKTPISALSDEFPVFPRAAAIMLGGSYKGQEFIGWGKGAGASVFSKFWSAVDSGMQLQSNVRMTNQRAQFTLGL